jgi:phage shock protein A
MEDKAMGIMNRMFHIFRADIHGVMDQIEDQGLILKQQIREMDQALDRKQAQLANMHAARDQVRKDLDRCQAEIKKMDMEITTALGKDRDDIAKHMIRRLRPLRDHAEELQRNMESLDQEAQEMEENLRQQRLAADDLRLRTKTFLLRSQKPESNIPNASANEASDEEIELELLMRKEALQGGAS